MDSWNGVKVLITGINGFVGGNIAEKLVELGAEVYGLVRTSKYNSFLCYEGIDKKISLTMPLVSSVTWICKKIT